MKTSKSIIIQVWNKYNIPVYVKINQLLCIQYYKKGTFSSARSWWHYDTVERAQQGTEGLADYTRRHLRDDHAMNHHNAALVSLMACELPLAWRILGEALGNWWNMHKGCPSHPAKPRMLLSCLAEFASSSVNLSWEIKPPNYHLERN